MAIISDIVAKARATVGHVIRVVSGGAANPQPNRPNLDFAGNCTVQDTGDAIRVTIPEVPAGSVVAGNTITLPAGSLAYVHNVGTPQHQILEFGIPLSEFDLEMALPVYQGGTGADNAKEARGNLDVPSTADLAKVDDAVRKNAQDIATKANDAAVVHIDGAENVLGNKTFSGMVQVPKAALKANTPQVASTEWVQAELQSRLAGLYLYARDGNSPAVDYGQGA